MALRKGRPGPKADIVRWLIEAVRFVIMISGRFRIHHRPGRAGDGSVTAEASIDMGC